MKAESSRLNRTGSSGRRRVRGRASCALNYTPPYMALILWKMACRCKYFWSITASSEENLLLRGSFKPDGEGEGAVRRRWT